MSQKDKDSLNLEEDKIIEEQIKQKEGKAKNKGKKAEETFWKKDIVNKRIVAFEKFNFDKNDFDIVKNEEEEEEVKTVDQIFYRFVQDEIKDVDNHLKRNMDEWNNRKENEKTYDNFKKVFASDYGRKNLFVPKLKGKAKDEFNIN